MSDKPVILVTNDDGITSKGINALAEVMQEFGDVIVVAPDSPQSGMGHAITIEHPLRLDKVEFHGEFIGWECSGTPVDCVKLAVNKILHRKPDLCVSGINHGSNSSINVIYSGTMSAAMEGAIENIPSIGFSLNNYDLNADFSACKHFVRTITKNVLEKGMPEKTLLNVNIPNKALAEIKGIKICRQAIAKWEEEFDERIDPRNRKYYWLTGKFKLYDEGEDTDEWALANDYVSVVPVQYDLTAHHALAHFNNMNWNA